MASSFLLYKYFLLSLWLSSLFQLTNRCFALTLFDPKDAVLEHKVSLTNMPRISYKIIKDDTSSFWVVNLNVKQETQVLPMLILPYTNSTWISTQSSQDSNIGSVVCDSAIACIPLQQDESDTQTITYLNYSFIQGGAAYLQAYPYSYTSLFSIEIANKEIAQLNPPLRVVGGLGLAMASSLSDSDSDPESSITFGSFLQSFYNLDNFVAGIYLSTNNFDVTSELLIGDFNIVYIKSGGYNATIASTSNWSLNLTSITSLNGSFYYNASLVSQVIFDPNFDGIGVPSSEYNNIEKAFTGINCSFTIPRICDCTNISMFPTLSFNFEPQNGQENSSAIFPPELYLQQGSECTLLIIPNNQINPTSQYSNTWIFGSPVMTYYYTVLNWTNGVYQVALYQTETIEEGTKFYIMLGAILALVIIGGFIACLNMIFSGKSEPSEPLLSDIEITEQQRE